MPRAAPAGDHNDVAAHGCMSLLQQPPSQLFLRRLGRNALVWLAMFDGPDGAHRHAQTNNAPLSAHGLPTPC